ncbi:hypothetical protein ATO6_11115 [Oceanicola sp. 22II-s10i]|uniref:DUF1499 domain-containing protein n=1 Tax=Oceanicola sp. 22II-s10i TaxID=1317116 RepID=UPI000B522AC0|nr:DUF1499 domain-containing protein [Oceanicola sp. 22II-s10i]OWU84856.1 hypothetical protein ATO6_11115 [Oceanicola sp. 22II-s10i]
MVWALAILVAAIVILQAVLRLAPIRAADWHVPPQAERDEDRPDGLRRRITAWPDALAEFDRIIRDTPRTELLAGSLRSGMMTYVTRSMIWGLPDLTTVRSRDSRLEIHARARFGRSDLGRNRRRVEHWLRRLERGG